MSLAKKQAELQEVQKAAEKLHKELEPLQKKASQLINQIRQLEFDNLLPLTPEKVMTTNYKVFENKKTYAALQKYLEKFKFLKCEGFNPDTERKALKIMLSQKHSMSDQLAELVQFLPFVSKTEFEKINKYNRLSRPDELQGQIRVVSVFEHTCSEDGSYSLLVGDNDVAALLVIRYSSPRILKVLPLKEMIDYIRENHPYELVKKVKENY